MGVCEKRTFESGFAHGSPDCQTSSEPHGPSFDTDLICKDEIERNRLGRLTIDHENLPDSEVARGAYFFAKRHKAVGGARRQAECAR